MVHEVSEAGWMCIFWAARLRDSGVVADGAFSPLCQPCNHFTMSFLAHKSPLIYILEVFVCMMLLL